MTKCDALYVMRKIMAELKIPRHTVFMSDRDLMKLGSDRYLVRKLMRDVEQSDEDPIRTVRRTYRMLEDTLVNSDDGRPESHTACSMMLNTVGAVLQTLHAWDGQWTQNTREERYL